VCILTVSICCADYHLSLKAHFDHNADERKSARNLAQPTVGGTSSSSAGAGATTAAGVDDAEKGSMATIPAPLLPPEMWRDIDASNFKVRGPTYNVDKVKTVSAPSLLKLLAIDLYEVPEPTQNICAHPKNRVNLALQRGEKTWVFVMNIMVPGPPFLSFVVYMTGDPVRMRAHLREATILTMFVIYFKEIIEQDTPFGRIAKRFFHGNDDEFRNNRFKLIPKVDTMCGQEMWIV
jgi:hypothetical protein